MTTKIMLDYISTYIRLIDLSTETMVEYIITRNKSKLELVCKLNELLFEFTKSAIKELDREKSVKNSR